jgi:LEA14-like dessication related protein
MKKTLFTVTAILCLLITSCNIFEDITFTGVENINITNFTKDGVDAEISARIKNPNFFSFTIHQSDVDATVGDINAGKISLIDRVKINGYSEEVYKFKIHSKFTNMGFADFMNIAAIAMSKNVKVQLKGNLKAGKWFINKTIDVNLIQEIPMGEK